MTPDVLELLTPILAFLSLGGMVLIGMKLRYSHIQRTRLGDRATPDVERLTHAVDLLKDELRLTRDEIHQLSERVEFTERLLERPRGGQADPEHARRREV